MRLIFIEIYHELRYLYIFLRILGFKIYYLNIETIDKNISDQNYKNLILYYKNKKIYLLDLINETSKNFTAEIFDNDFNGQTYHFNKKILDSRLKEKLYKNFNIDIPREKFEIYMSSILQSNIQRKFQSLGSIINYWCSYNVSEHKTIIIINNLSDYFICLNDKNIKIQYYPLSFINFFFKKINLCINFCKKKFLVKKNKKKIIDKNFLPKKNINSKYLYIFHKSTVYANLFKKDLFFFNNDKFLSKENVLSVLYNNNNEGIINILNISLYKKIFFLFKVINFFIRLFFSNMSLNNLALTILYSKIFYRFLVFSYNLEKFKNVETAFIDWDTHCPKELILALELKKITTICVQERSIQSQYKYFYNIICDIFLSSVPNMKNIFLQKPFSRVNNVIEYGNYRQDHFFNDKYDQLIAKKFNISKDDITVVLFLHHTENKYKDQLNKPALNWDNQLYILNEIFALFSEIKNLKIIFRFKNIEWIKNNKFQEIISKIERTNNMFIDKDYETSFFSYSLARFANVVVGPHSSILDELIEAGFENVLILDYGYRIKSIVRNLKYENTKFICKNSNDLQNRLKIILNDKKSLNFKNNLLQQQISYKDKLYEILKKKIIL